MPDPCIYRLLLHRIRFDATLRASSPFGVPRYQGFCHMSRVDHRHRAHQILPADALEADGIAVLVAPEIGGVERDAAGVVGRPQIMLQKLASLRGDRGIV